MGRLVLLHLCLFLLPFAIYAGYLAAVHRRIVDPELWTRGTNFRLVVCGLVMVIGGFVGLATFTGGDPEGTYVPPRVEDGRVVPGRVVPN